MCFIFVARCKMHECSPDEFGDQGFIHANSSGCIHYQPCRVSAMLEFSTVPCRDDKGHNTLKHWAVLKGLGSEMSPAGRCLMR